MTATRPVHVALLPDAEATVRLGACLAATRPTPAVIHLRGDLGAGKSTLARAFLRALGVEGTIRSPTYTLVERYPVAGGEAAHLDLYRLGDAAELDFLGLDELEAHAVAWLVEWPERGGNALPPCDLEVTLGVVGEGRQVRIQGQSDAGHAWLCRLGSDLFEPT